MNAYEYARLHTLVDLGDKATPQQEAQCRALMEKAEADEAAEQEHYNRTSRGRNEFHTEQVWDVHGNL